jgi:RNA polymerase sigma factor (sigma-70 family)
VATGVLDQKTPAELLTQFISTGDQAPFAEIVRRYAGMVFHVCQQVLKNAHDAEDVTQAVFLTLATQAKTSGIKYVGPWLQQVAFRLSLDYRKSIKRRELREVRHFNLNHRNGNGNGNGHAPPASLALDESESHAKLKALLADELGKLPTKYRLPLILHYFGGMSREQMAKELRCKASTLGVRLFRARKMLSQRLVRRGVTISSALVGVLLTMLVRETVTGHLAANVCLYTASLAGSGAAGTTCMVPPHLLALAQSASRALALAKIKSTALVALLVLSSLATGSQVYAQLAPPSLVPQFLQIDWSRLFRVRLPSLPRLELPTPPVQLGSAPEPGPILGEPRPLSAFGPSAAVVTEWVMEPVGTAGDLHPVRLQSTSFKLPRPEAAEPLAVPAPVAATTVLPRQPVPPPRPTELVASVWEIAVSAARTGVVPLAKGEGDRPPLHAGVVPTAPGPEHGQSVTIAAGPSESLPELVLGPAGSARSSPAGGGATVSRPAPVELDRRVSPEDFVLLADDSSLPLALVQRQLAAAQAAGQSTDRSATGRGGAGSEGTITNPNLGYHTRTWNYDDHALAGWGTVNILGIFDNSGIVTADGRGKDRTLAIRAALVANSLDNPTDGSAGWYASRGGRLELPPIPLVRGQSMLTWGESAEDPVLDLVHSLRLGFAPVERQTMVSIALLSPDRADVAALGGGGFLALWSIEADGGALDDLVATVRFDPSMLGEADGLALWRYGDGSWTLAGGLIDWDNRLITADLGSATYLALGAACCSEPLRLNVAAVPEPAAGIALAAAGLLLGRRRRRRRG